jgi:hypothetical protein
VYQVIIYWFDWTCTNQDKLVSRSQHVTYKMESVRDLYEQIYDLSISKCIKL